MNYQRIYDKIIEKRRLYPLNRKDGYCEYHHIIPKCIGGDYCPRSKKWNKRGTNLVGLTAREHFIVHRILERIYTYNGETLTLKQISEKYNIKLGTLYTRICRMKMSIEDAIKTKIGRW